MSHTSSTILCGFKARIYPTAKQAVRLNQWSGSLRFLWNRLLDLQREEEKRSNKLFGLRELQKRAVELKSADGTEWLADLPAHAVLNTARQLHEAFDVYFRQRKSRHQAGFPRPKKKFIREVGIYCVGQTTKFTHKAVRLPKLGIVKLRHGRIPTGRLVAASIHRDGSRWMISAKFECRRPDPLSKTDTIFGIDLGVRTLATAFDGEKFIEIPCPRKLRKTQRRLARARRRHAARQTESRRKRIQAERIRSIHRKIRNYRQDFLHQLSHRLTAKADVIRLETLNISAMMRNRRLALSVIDAGMARLITLCTYKADWRGRRIEHIDPWFPSSQLCSRCGAKNSHMKEMRRRIFTCAQCGYQEDRDRNAARNIFSYSEERRNDPGNGDTRMDRVDQDANPVALDEVRMSA